MARALEAAFPQATVLIMTAAVADHRPRQTEGRKMKKGQARMVLELERNPDILAGLAARKGGRLVVGFAAETHDLVPEARRKLRAKRLDLIVANDVTVPGAGFGSEANAVHLLDGSGRHETLPLLPKEEVAARVLDWIAGRRRQRAARGTLRRVR
jgi:phosphopantothenoylcysteine decarboxylase/phosphopantothenate--cysteine ligase